MEENSASSLVPAPEKTAAEATAEAGNKDDKHEAASAAVHEAAHAAANVEAQAATEGAKILAEAEKLAKEVGAKAAEKWAEAKLAELEKNSNARLEELKTWLEERIAKIEGKKPEEQPAPAAGGSPESAPRSEPAKKRYRRI